MSNSRSSEEEHFNPTLDKIAKERFWTKVNKTENCWFFLSSIDRNGYGLFWLDGKARLAHKVSYFFEFGAYSSSWHVLHNCDTRNCVNPKHLRLGTHKENMQDKKIRGRAPKGANTTNSKYTETQIIEVYSLRAQKLTLREISERTKIPIGFIGNLLTGKPWAWLREQWTQVNGKI